MAVTKTVLLVCCTFVLAVEAAPLDTNRGSDPKQSVLQEQTDEQQLESLKSMPENVAMVKSNSESFFQMNGKTQTREMHEEHVEDVASGKMVAKVVKEIVTSSDSGHGKPKTVVKTEVDIPSQGIHKITVDKKARNRHSDSDTEDFFSPYDSIHYTPTDMAEYIQKTGDDEGVAMAIEELVNEGLMSRNEAAIYLEEVKNELESLQVGNLARPSVLSVSRDERRLNPPSSAQKFHTEGQHSMTSSDMGDKSTFTNSKGTKHEHKFSHETPKFRNDEDEMAAAEDENLARNRILDSDDDVDYNDLLERLRIADFLYKEYSLEEVIYQLAKEMFVQSIVKGNRDAEESLQRFSNFLQAETAEGRISKELEKKILDVVMAALMDAVGDQEQQELKMTLKPGVVASRLRSENKSRSVDKHKSLEAKNKSRELKQLVKKSLKSASEESRPKGECSTIASDWLQVRLPKSSNSDRASNTSPCQSRRYKCRRRSYALPDVDADRKTEPKNADRGETEKA